MTAKPSSDPHAYSRRCAATELQRGPFGKNQVSQAWVAGRIVQYLVLNGYDDEWTDYTELSPPDISSGRLEWRVKPTPLQEPAK